MEGSKGALELMGRRNKLMTTKESMANGRSFIPRPTDVFVCAYPKCGTTWVTQICHGLRSNGSMEFDEITEVCPWDITALDCGQDMNASQVAEPRVIKSHEPFETIAKNLEKHAKYIHVVRDPLDSFVSFYHFMPNYMGIAPGEITMEMFCDSIFAGVSNSGQIWDYYLSYWRAMETLKDRILWVFYEDLKADLPREVKRIAEFMSITDTGGLFDKVVHQSSYKFMSEHRKQFDDHFLFDRCKKRMGMSEDSEFVRIGKVRKGGGVVGSRQAIPEKVRDRLQAKWQDIIQREIQCEDYEAFKSAVKNKINA